MNNRLEKIASYIVDGKGVADIGTDHGFLPVALCQRGYPGNIVASDINSDPLNKAIRAAKNAGFSETIKFLLSDGLEACDPDEFDRVVIAGMGGDTIAGIISRVSWYKDSKHVFHLQPMSKQEVLRAWLMDNDFEIINEDLVVDNETIYQIISACFGSKNKLNCAQLYIGRRELHSDIALYEQLRIKHIERFERALEGMKNAETRDMSAKILDIEQLLEQFRRL